MICVYFHSVQVIIQHQSEIRDRVSLNQSGKRLAEAHLIYAHVIQDSQRITLCPSKTPAILKNSCTDCVDNWLFTSRMKESCRMTEINPATIGHLFKERSQFRFIVIFHVKFVKDIKSRIRDNISTFSQQEIESSVQYVMTSYLIASIMIWT